MGPRLISRGEKMAADDGTVKVAASMGPRLISRGEAATVTHSREKSQAALCERASQVKPLNHR